MKTKTQTFYRVTILAMLVLMLVFGIGSLWRQSVKVYAQEGEIEQVIEENEPNDETLNQGFTDKATAFFENKILPVLLGIGGIISVGVIGLPALLRKAKKLTNALKSANEEISRLKGVMAAYGGVESKLAEIKTGADYEALIKGAVVDATNNALESPIAAQVKSITDNSRAIDVMSEQMQALINAAKIVWAGKDGAEKALSTVPSANALRKRESEVQRLRKLLRDRGDADTEKLINDIAEAADNE